MLKKLIAGVMLTGILSVYSVQAQVPLETSPFWSSTETNVYSTGMVWRDCNLDSYIDGFFSNGNDIVIARNFVYMSDEGVVPTSATWMSDDLRYSGHCAVGDINDDGYPDFAVANYIGTTGFSSPERSVMYLNDGGTLNTSPDWVSLDSMYTFSCAFGDVDGDGDLDLAFATGDGYNNVYTPERIYFNIDGVLQTTPGWQSSASGAALDVAWGDVDKDGDLDLAFCYDFRPTALYINDGGVMDTEPSWEAPSTFSGNTLMWGDVNGDGWLDLVVAYNNQLAAGGYFQAYFNDGTGNLEAMPGWRSADGGYGSALAMYDYDNDGDDDLAAGRWFDEARIYENTGSTFTTSPVWRSDISSVVEELAWVDVDGDGVRSYSDTLDGTSGNKVYYTTRHPLHVVDSVKVDGVLLANADYCYDMFYGWVSLADAPTTDVEIYYGFSEKCDLAVANWGGVNHMYANTTELEVPCCGLYTGGYTGNANCSTDGKVTLTDITRLIDYVYISKDSLCCPENGNANGSTDGKVTLSDITRVIDHVYISKLPTELCSE